MVITFKFIILNLNYYYTEYIKLGLLNFNKIKLNKNVVTRESVCVFIAFLPKILQLLVETTLFMKGDNLLEEKKRDSHGNMNLCHMDHPR